MNTAREYRIKVIVGVRKEGVISGEDGRLVVSVNAKREQGKANARARALLAEYFGIRTEDVVIVRGHVASSKIVRLRNATT